MGTFRYSNKIKVVYDNGVSDQISPSLLDSLITSRRVEQFERSEGWAEIGIDPIRGMGGARYGGDDRRLS